MANSKNNILTLNQRIEKDLNELNTIGEIQDAKNLNGLIDAKSGQTSFATKALPGYYAGNRKAKTVMVMLNPGEDVGRANSNLMSDIQKRSMKNAGDIANYHKWCINYGHIVKGIQDNFDLKQAFFLNKWIGTGISLPVGLDENSDKQTKLDAKEIVLTQKLSMDLIPYASSSFSDVTKGKVSLVIPFVETLFEEIFSRDDRYVIFCAGKFEMVFKEYNKVHPGAIKFLRKERKLIPDSKISGSCSIISITYKGKTIRALIANTFSSKALPNAFKKMEQYGEFCYNEYIKQP
jgi:hypothetical protein